MPGSVGLGVGQAVTSAELGQGEPSVIPGDWVLAIAEASRKPWLLVRPVALAGAVSQQVTVGPGGLREVALPWAAVVFLRGDSCVQTAAGTSRRGLRSERKHPQDRQ